MKKNKLTYIGLLLALVSIIGCTKESANLGVSDITYYAVITIDGEQFMTIDQGTPYVDPGVLVEINGQSVDYDTEGTVDHTTPGVYVLTYSKINEDGYAASAKRYVGVIDPAAKANDFTGVYQRTFYGTAGAGGFATWVKVMDGLYTTDNVGGVPGDASYIYPVYVFNFEGNSIMVPSQPNAKGGEVYCSSTKAGDSDIIDFIPGAIGTDSYIWSVVGSGFGTNLRTFTRVE